MNKLSQLKKEDIYRKKIFLRADLDVPIKDGKVLDDTRLNAWYETLEYLLKNQAQVYLAGHLGRPAGVDEKLSLKPVAKWILGKLELNEDLKEFDLNGLAGFATNSGVSVLENLRFYKEEEGDDEGFSKKLASLADIYINDAFASSHRKHASIVGITKFLPSYAGFRLEKEVEELSKILNNPKRPLVVILGGAKIETKLPLVEKMHAFADFVLVGGEIAENDKVLLRVQHEKIEGKKSALIVADLNEQNSDTTLKSAENFVQVAQTAQTIVWNGPLGIVEDPKNIATLEMAKELSEINAYTIVGGGDTVAFLKKNNLLDKFSFASVGGGAMLEYLSGIKLPGLLALEK